MLLPKLQRLIIITASLQWGFIQIIKQSDANAVNVSESAREEFINLEKQYLAKGLKFDVSSDQSEYTMASAHI